MSNIKEKLQTLLDSIPEEKLKEVLDQLQQQDNKVKVASDFLFNACQGMTLEMTKKDEITYYNKDQEWLFHHDYKHKKLYYSYYRIYLFLEKNYSTNEIDVNNFIQGWVDINLNWRRLTPDKSIVAYEQLWTLT